ncbi:MAG: hypothetical protein ACOC9T_01090 [Myxococcota bacterium]
MTHVTSASLEELAASVVEAANAADGAPRWSLADVDLRAVFGGHVAIWRGGLGRWRATDVAPEGALEALHAEVIGSGAAP